MVSFFVGGHRALDPSIMSAVLPVRPPVRGSLRQISCQMMAGEPAGHPLAVRTVSIPYSDLKERNKDLSRKIEEGFGPDGLGIVSVSDVPGFPYLRKQLLLLAPRVANLPDSVKKELEDPDSRYNFGWSHGKEKLESGKPDTFKGSYYANPVLDTPTKDIATIQRYPSYCRPNKWPTNSLPELEIAFKSLGQLMLEVGLLLAHHCDEYVMKGTRIHEDKSLVGILKRSRCHKGRLLYYFPKHSSVRGGDITSMSSWCGWHTDYGSLTGLACGLFTRNSVTVACPDSDAGLHVQTRNSQIVKVIFGEDEIAYQIGETAEILSGGCICATPHCVRAPNSEDATGIDRSTFALFMQPDWDEILNIPTEIHRHQELISPNRALTFGEYSEILLNKYYYQRTKN